MHPYAGMLQDLTFLLASIIKFNTEPVDCSNKLLLMYFLDLGKRFYFYIIIIAIRITDPIQYVTGTQHLKALTPYDCGCSTINVAIS